MFDCACAQLSERQTNFASYLRTGKNREFGLIKFDALLANSGTFTHMMLPNAIES